MEKVGDNQDVGLVGKHVGVFPLIPCRECSQCKEKHYEMCANYDYVGSRRDGGFAELVAVPVWNLLLLDDSISFTSAAMLEPLAVALHAIKIGEVKKKNSVCIIGTGMIGISAAQWAKSFGVEDVTVIGRNESKRNLVENCGLKYKVSNSKDEIGQYDFVLEAVGNPGSIELAIYATKPGGKIVFMGNPSGQIDLKQDTYWRILRKQLCICGTWNSSYDGENRSDWTDAVEALSQKKVNVDPLISHTFKQDQLMSGMKLMKEHREPYCKVISIWNQD